MVMNDARDEGPKKIDMEKVEQLIDALERDLRTRRVCFRLLTPCSHPSASSQRSWRCSFLSWLWPRNRLALAFTRR